MGRVGLAVALGGALGAVLRWLFGLAGLELARRLPEPMRVWPIGTLAVNLLGCLAIGVLAGLFEHRWSPEPAVRAFVLIGLLGGFTTFSSFAFESVQLFEDGRLAVAVTYLVLSPALGLVAALLGLAVARGL